MKFDLTKDAGFKKALDTFKLSLSLSPAIMAYAGKKMISNLLPKDTTTIQRDTAIELIRAGRKNNVDKMKITLDKTVGMGIGFEVDGIPVKVKANTESSSKIDLVVKYK